MCTVASDEEILKMGQVNTVNGTVNGNGYRNGNGHINDIPSSSSRFVPSPPAFEPPVRTNGAPLKAAEGDKQDEVKAQTSGRDARQNGTATRATRSASSHPAASQKENASGQPTAAVSCVSVTESVVSTTLADRKKEKPLVDTVYEFLVNDVDYVLVGNMGTSADGHPTFGPRPRAGPKSRCSPEEQLLCVNLLRQLEFTGDMQSVETERLEWKLTRCFRLLNSCGYPFDDIVTVVAFAAIYFPSIKASVCSHTGGWDNDEVANVLVVLIYISHAFCFDETCPIGHWHAWVVRSYCSLQTLNLVVLRILQLRRFHLTVTRKEWRGVSFALKKGIRGPQREQVPEGPEHFDIADA
jgi:hypothetical protein